MAAEQLKLSPDQVVGDVRRRVGHFTEDPYFRLGNADSVHGVVFGKLSNLGEVAIKPFGKNGLGRAKGENRNLQRVAEAGFEALEPLAVAQGGLAAYLITRRRTGLRHLGQVKWDANVASRRVKGVVVPTLVEAASTLAAWHNQGIFHGDAQVKNLAYDKKTGQSVYIDAEGAQFNPSGNKSVELGNEDLSLFGVSALWRGMLHDRSSSYRAGFLGAHLLDPYLEAVMYPTQGVTSMERQESLQQEWVEAIDLHRPPAWISRDGQADGSPVQPAPMTKVA